MISSGAMEKEESFDILFFHLTLLAYSTFILHLFRLYNFYIIDVTSSLRTHC